MSEAVVMGWEIDNAPAAALAAVRWLSAGLALTGADDVAAVCETACCETVFVEIRADRLIVSDRGETCRYLESGDDAHRAMGADEIHVLCAQSGAELADVPDMWPHITVAPQRTETVAEAVAIVGRTIDRVFAAALTVPAQ